VGLAGEYRFSCETIERNRLHSAGGVELAAEYQWVVDDGEVVAVMSTESYGQWSSFLRGFRRWLEEGHPDVADGMEYNNDDFPVAESVPDALEFVGRFVEASPNWPLWSPEIEPLLTGAVDGIELHNADASQRALVVWALGRFEAAGLPAPPVISVTFPPAEACFSGFAGWMVHDDTGSNIEVCYTSEFLTAGSEFALLARRTILHELAHVWERAHVAEASRQAFLDLRNLEAWTGAEQWARRANEQAAEVLVWGLMEELTLPRLPDPTCDGLAEAFELVTGTTAAARQQDCNIDAMYAGLPG
jgi:hypothetical protein